MGREAKAIKSAEKSAIQKPVKKEVKVWTTEEVRAAVLTGKIPITTVVKPTETFEA